LGKGIDALLQGRDLGEMERLSSVISVPVERLQPNPNQPRKAFSEEALQELTDSVREKGIIQPILAEEQEDGSYRIIAGERRYRAAQAAGLEMVPVLPREFTDEEKLEVALIENLQREDLNPIEEAQAFQALMDTAGVTQDELAKRLGMNRSTIANTLRLLKLPSDVQEKVIAGGVSSGHARAILSVKEPADREKLVARIQEEQITVREAEHMASALNSGVWEQTSAGSEAGAGTEQASSDGTRQKSGRSKGGGSSSGGSEKSPELRDMEERFLEALGTKVVVRGSHERGKIEIDYYSMEDLERLFEIITHSERPSADEV
jgi:ParB family chromosome partitioning protein